MEVTERDREFMTMALAVCRRGVEAGQSPFGAVIARDGVVIADGHNRVWETKDPSAHGEVVCIRNACQSLGEIHLEGAVIYSTTEPCPMCFAAIHWARIGRIVYGASIADAASFGFNELAISNQTMAREGQCAIEVVAGVQRDESLVVFREWAERSGNPY